MTTPSKNDYDIAEEWVVKVRHGEGMPESALDLAMLVANVRLTERRRASAIACFFVADDDIQQAGANDAPTKETAWNWGVSHAAIKIANAIMHGPAPAKGTPSP